MDTETPLSNKIKNVIEELGYDDSLLSNYQKKHLLKIDSAIQEMIERAVISMQTIKDNKINKNTISKVSGVSRPTIDKNKVLIDYIKYYSSKYESVTNSFDNKELRQQLRESQDTIKKLVSHDADVALKDTEIFNLQVQIETLRTQIESLRKENSDLQKSYEEVKKALEVVQSRMFSA